MTITRRAALGLGAGAIALPTLALAQAWRPTRDVEFVIPFAVGGGADLMARVIHRIITDERLVPVPVNPVNRPGGGGAVGIAYVAASRRNEPHTIVAINGTTQITPIMVPTARTLSEIRPIANTMLDDFLLFVRADSPHQTAAAFAAHARGAPPRSVNFSTGGTTDQMAITVFGRAIGAELNMVNFNSGGEALTALLGGHVQASIGNPLEFMGHLQSRAVRALGVFRDNRFTDLPDVPTMKEQGINAENFQMWRGIGVPRGVNDAAAAYWTEVMQRVLATEAWKRYLRENVASEAPMFGADFASFLERQERLYRELLGRPA
ncbi:Bug family tripartite tricarboxylate transporter substrate binding protein [Falsiroseomonas oryziterrae]|uniref:Bug family tripartite tricarboxylate transporter substrate binding protein n=1 Tax=Falsiroseomonas oryziterrae TaxID=2911368 RepID=UPI001F3018F7|nr:tripartite tricarboxylate transporter substrate binding protein [Roseomonas sp. NPKOSM-4]